MHGALRILRTVGRRSNLKRFDEVVIRTLACQRQMEVLPMRFLPQGGQVRIIRKYGEWAPNLVKSPFPDFEIPNKLFSDFFWSKHEKWDDLTAVVCGVTGRELKYSQLRRLCRRMATSLLKDGLKPGEVVAMVLPNIPEFPVVVLGIIEAGLVVSTVNPVYTAEEIAYQLKDVSSAAVITIPEKLETVLEAKKLLKEEGAKNADNLRIICTPSVMGAEVNVPEGIGKYSDFVSDEVDDSLLPSLQTKSRTKEDVVFIPYSSGTTGRPKGVCLTHVNLMAGILNVVNMNEMEEASSSVQEIVPCILPAFHIYGFSIVMAQTLYCGGKVIMLPKFEENMFLNVLVKYKPTVLYIAPPLVIYIGASPKVTKDHLKSLKAILSGAAPCADTDILRCIEKSPSTVSYRQGYGLTETSPGVIIMPRRSGVDKYSSVGRPLPSTVVKVSDLQTGQALGPNEEGEIWVKGPQVMKCYLNNEKATAEVIDSEGWFHTGDIGYYDADKDFYITDRLKELIKVKGFQVAPAELEAVLRSHPDVQDAGVVGVPDQRKGEAPVGFVQLKPGAVASVDDLKNFMSQKVAKFKQIENFVFVNAIPKSAAGKILRKELRAMCSNNINLENYLNKNKV